HGHQPQTEGRQAPGTGWPLRRHQGAARRLLHHRRSRPRRSPGVGVALSHSRWRRGQAQPADRAPRQDPGRGRVEAQLVTGSVAEAVNEAVERAARDSYGRLLAFLSARTRDIAAAEDALSDAFAAALGT